MFAVFTFLGAFQLFGLMMAVVFIIGLIFWAIESGGIFAWFFANDMMDLLGVALEAIAKIISDMRD